MPKAMIISVGGTPEPIIKSINEHGPDFISLLVSQQTIDTVGEIRARISSKVPSEVSILDNANDLLHCHAKAEEAVERVIRRNFKGQDVVVDYTGGTKNMSVALSLAAISHGFIFSYVGGTERTKDGVGIVVNGCERVYQSVNPWDFLAIEERKRISLLFNTYQFKAARALVETLLEKTTSFRPLFRQIGFIIDGFQEWDLFRHGSAAQAFKRAKVDDLLAGNDKSMRVFAQQVARSIEQVNSTLQASDSGKKVCRELVLDLFANAERRVEEGKVDDAVLRIYRLVEMLAQERLLNQYRIDTSDVQREQVPEPLGSEFIKQYERDGRIRLAQSAAFQLLKALDDPLGCVFTLNEKKFANLQRARNYSYLAHGVQSVKEGTYLKLKEFVLGLGLFELSEAPVFPKLFF
jgi:CRISPR-associated protein (TIGR02710 family)